MTTYHLSLTTTDGPTESSAAGRILASLTSEEPEVMAATLRAAADKLDPPRGAYRATRGITRSADGNLIETEVEGATRQGDPGRNRNPLRVTQRPG